MLATMLRTHILRVALILAGHAAEQVNGHPSGHLQQLGLVGVVGVGAHPGNHPGVSHPGNHPGVSQ